MNIIPDASDIESFNNNNQAFMQDFGPRGGVRPELGGGIQVKIFRAASINFSSEIHDIKRKIINFIQKIIIFAQKIRIIKRKIIVLSEKS